jgi:hypothetical protein
LEILSDSLLGATISKVFRTSGFRTSFLKNVSGFKSLLVRLKPFH